MKFEVRALSPDQRVHTLAVEAADEAGARRHAVAQGFKPLRIEKSAGQSGAGLASWHPRRRGAGFSVVLFSQELLALLDAGLSLQESLEALAEKSASAETQSVIGHLLAKLREGTRLSDAVAARPDLFTPLYVGTLRAAERTGDLARALQRYVDYQSRIDAVRSQIVGACIYPAILLVVGGGVALFLLGYVVPSFAAVYRDSGREMPFFSQLLMSWGDLVSRHGAWVAAIAVALAACVGWGLRRLKGPGGWLDLFKRIPGIAQQARQIELARLYLTLGMLLEGGIAIRQALDMVSGTVAPGTRRQVAAAEAAVTAGQSFSDAFEAHRLATPVALRMLRVGERSGQLGGMLMRAALFHEGESARFIDRFSKTFEPALMAAIGIVIGAIVVLLYMPIFDLAGSIQ